MVECAKEKREKFVEIFQMSSKINIFIHFIIERSLFIEIPAVACVNYYSNFMTKLVEKFYEKKNYREPFFRQIQQNPHRTRFA